MEIFKEKYQANRHQNNLKLIDKATIDSIVQNIAKKIKAGTIYKGKSG